VKYFRGIYRSKKSWSSREKGSEKTFSEKDAAVFGRFYGKSDFQKTLNCDAEKYNRKLK